MLLDYAAELKCRTQKGVIKTVISLAHLPQDIHHFILTFSHAAREMIHQLQSEISSIGNRPNKAEKDKKRLQQTRQQLEKITQLMQQGNTVMQHIGIDTDNNSI